MLENLKTTILVCAAVATLALSGCNKQADPNAAANAAATQKQQHDDAVKKQLQDDAARQQLQAEKAQREHDEQFRKQVEANRKKHSSMNKGSDTWKTYLP